MSGLEILVKALIISTYRGFRERQRYAPLVNEKTGVINAQTADFIRHYAKKWRKKSMFQVLLHYRAARFQDFVNLSQQVHIYNQRVVAGLNKCIRSVPTERINTREINSSQLGPLPVPTKKLPFRLDQIPFYDTQYMVNPANSMTRQTYSRSLLPQHADDEEPWDSPLQRNPSMTSCLLTYNAYKKEQACQTNWDRMGESDVIYNQNFYRDPQIIRRNQVQMNMHAYNNYNYNNNSNYQNAASQSWMGNRTGSRRNSLKGYSAPPPPPMPPMNMQRYDANRKAQSQSNQQMEQMNRMNQNYRNRTSFVPADPVRELQDIVRRSNDGNDDEAPFNFRAMLRKTNYQRPESTTYEFNNRMDDNDYHQQQGVFQTPKLHSTGQRFDERGNKANYGVANKFGNRAPPLRQASTVGRNFEDNDAKSFEEAGSYVEEEIAPGVTLSGYAVDI